MGFDYETEMTRRQKELDEGIEDLMYPHLLQNREDIPDRMGLPAKPKNDKNLKNKTGPEKQNFKAELEEKLIAKCKKCGHEFDYLSVQEAGMGYVKCPKCEEAVTQDDLIIAPYTKTNYPSYLNKYPEGARNVWIEVWNSVYNETKSESRAFAAAWSKLKKWMDRHSK
jgi:DNA-directed RNA polymerase subunit RPC12/RpoP